MRFALFHTKFLPVFSIGVKIRNFVLLDDKIMTKKEITSYIDGKSTNSKREKIVSAH